jgi:hypothetical protein
MSKIVPASMTNIKLSGGIVSSYTWNRSAGVDSYGPSTRLVKGGGSSTPIALPTLATSDVNVTYAIADATDRANFIAAQQQAGRTYSVSGNNVTVTYKAGALYIAGTPNYVSAGDTVYINLRTNVVGAQTVKGSAQSLFDVNWYAAPTQGVVGSTGSFQIRPISDQEILTYHEMCFIKAEVYLRKGDAASAYTAYRAGIQAHLDYMQSKLNQWGAYAAFNPDMTPMDQTAINTYLSSNAVAQGAGTLTMSDIMLQKYIAMGCSIENYNDMRRFNFSAGNVGTFGVVYPGYDRGPLFAGSAYYIGGSKTEPRYWQRRWQLPATLELNYNSTNALAINAHATDPSVWSMPVWWDCATDAEYYGYLK